MLLINSLNSYLIFLQEKKAKKKLKNIGGFGSISNIPRNLKNPKIVACTDGVGTKIEIANLLNKFDTIGIDLVAMSVNDLIVQGARPLFFLRIGSNGDKHLAVGIEICLTFYS